MRSGRLCTSVILGCREAFDAGGQETVKEKEIAYFRVSSAQTFKIKLYCGRNVL